MPLVSLVVSLCNPQKTKDSDTSDTINSSLKYYYSIRTCEKRRLRCRWCHYWRFSAVFRVAPGVTRRHCGVTHVTPGVRVRKKEMRYAV